MFAGSNRMRLRYNVRLRFSSLFGKLNNKEKGNSNFYKVVTLFRGQFKNGRTGNILL